MAKRYNEMDIGGLIEEFVSALLQSPAVLSNRGLDQKTRRDVT
jgi:hypothetical protein